tara:strand:- start:3021 stop:3398 length:378 start_codon:yes stop_codon:yes gene_type:complete
MTFDIQQFEEACDQEDQQAQKNKKHRDRQGRKKEKRTSCKGKPNSKPHRKEHRTRHGNKNLHLMSVEEFLEMEEREKEERENEIIEAHMEELERDEKLAIAHQMLREKAKTALDKARKDREAQAV